jgi:type III pantothenate kinase
MILAVDIGNSDIVIGISEQNFWKHIWRIRSMSSEPELAYLTKISDYFLENHLKPSDIRQIILSSVVPELTDKIANVLYNFFYKTPLILNPTLYSQLPFKVNNPYEIGSDLVANGIAAFSKYKQNCIVVDFGTALTFTTIAKEGKIIGVAIAPGLKTAIKSLSQNTAKLFDVPLQMPTSALGHNTVSAIQAGIMFGYEGLVKSMLQQIRKELQDDCPAIATGGLSSVIPTIKDAFHEIEPNLTLEGLKYIGEWAVIQGLA